MIGYIYAQDHWLGVMSSIRVFGAQDTQEPTPLPKANAIAAIYFPQFVTALSELGVVTKQYEIWMFEGARKRLAGNVKELNDGHSEVYDPYIRKREEVLSRLKEFAASEFAVKPPLWKRSKKVE